MSKKPLNPQILYTIAFGLLGIIVAFFLTQNAMQLITGVFWVFVFDQTEIPSWMNPILVGVAIVLFITLVFYAVQLGAWVSRIDLRSGEERFRKMGRNWLIVSLCASILFGFYIYQELNKERIEKQALKGSLEDLLYINRLGVFQIDDGFEVGIDILGNTEDKYELTVTVDSNGYLESKLFEQTEDVELKFRKQEFFFAILFEQISKEYRKALESKVEDFSEKFHVEEYLKVTATLRLREKSSAQDEAPTFSYEDQEEGLVKVLFRCQLDTCKVIQREKEVTTSLFGKPKEGDNNEEIPNTTD